jgi:hypothetical protein
MGGPLPVLIVDAADVVGSRPGGRWRDRHRATTRHARASRDDHEELLVVERQARHVSAPHRVNVFAPHGTGSRKWSKAVNFCD